LLGQLSINQYAKPWKIMHPYANRLGFKDLKEINVAVIGKFPDDVPSGLCAVIY
jgi:hypothetical protein